MNKKEKEVEIATVNDPNAMILSICFYKNTHSSSNHMEALLTFIVTTDSKVNRRLFNDVER